jgi:hypothetical protein
MKTLYVNKYEKAKLDDFFDFVEKLHEEFEEEKKYWEGDCPIGSRFRSGLWQYLKNEAHDLGEHSIARYAEDIASYLGINLHPNSEMREEKHSIAVLYKKIQFIKEFLIEELIDLNESNNNTKQLLEAPF